MKIIYIKNKIKNTVFFLQNRTTKKKKKKSLIARACDEAN